MNNRNVIRGFFPGWDSRAVARVVMVCGELNDDDVDDWSDDEVNSFLLGNDIRVFEERDAVFTYSLYVHQGTGLIAQITEAY